MPEAYPAVAPQNAAQPASLTPIPSLLQVRISNYRQGAFDYQFRRHDQWRETYTLYRDKVITNRLTQRQSVNVPLMKETIKTILSKTDEFTDLFFENLDNDKQEEIFINEYWNWNARVENLEIKDIVDKKQVGLYGRSFIKLNLKEGRVSFEVLEPYDVLIERYADPADIDGTANYVAHVNIYRTLSAVAENPNYDRVAIERLKIHYATAMGLQKSAETYQAFQAKVQRLQDLGVWDTENPKVGETYVELQEHYLRQWDEKKNCSYIRVVVTCGSEILMNDRLDSVLGINFFPISTWADDVERADIWSDGVGDTVRTPNKILNSFFSQLIENRTLRNYGMTFYDYTAPADGEKWAPQSYEPGPFAWIPTHGDPNRVTKRVEVPDLADALPHMNYIKAMVESATASTASEKGVKEQGQATLGQIQIMMANSNERIISMAKFYRPARMDLGNKWYQMVIANKDYLKPVKLYKKSYKGNYFTEEFDPKSLKAGAGYVCTITSTAEREQSNIQTIQKMKAIQADFEGNEPLRRIIQKKGLDLLDLNPDEVKEVMDFEKQKLATAAETLDAGEPPVVMPPEEEIRSPIQPEDLGIPA